MITRLVLAHLLLSSALVLAWPAAGVAALIIGLPASLGLLAWDTVRTTMGRHL